MHQCGQRNSKEANHVYNGADHELTEGESLADLMEQIGNVPLNRIPLRPPPGTATEQDVLAAERHPLKRLYELVDGVLVEKAMGTKESALAAMIVYYVIAFLKEHDLGIVLGADGMLKVQPGLVRIPDVSFISWDRLPQRKLPEEPITAIVPNLAVEVINKGNTTGEIQRKLRDYFFAGVEVVWIIYPETQTVEIYTAAATSAASARVRAHGALSPARLLTAAPGIVPP